MCSNNKGFSLIELMIALLILSVGLLSLASLQGTAIKGNRHGNQISQATTLAEDRIEEIRNTDFDDVDNVAFPTPENNLSTSGVYTRTTVIEDDVPMLELKRITVTVSWSDGRSHDIVLRTIISNEG